MPPDSGGPVQVGQFTQMPRKPPKETCFLLTSTTPVSPPACMYPCGNANTWKSLSPLCSVDWHHCQVPSNTFCCSFCGMTPRGSGKLRLLRMGLGGSPREAPQLWVVPQLTAGSGNCHLIVLSLGALPPRLATVGWYFSVSLAAEVSFYLSVRLKSQRPG